jgi:hypothetical protein
MMSTADIQYCIFGRVFIVKSVVEMIIGVISSKYCNGKYLLILHSIIDTFHYLTYSSQNVGITLFENLAKSDLKPLRSLR